MPAFALTAVVDKLSVFEFKNLPFSLLPTCLFRS
jgi:hypothetical protein